MTAPQHAADHAAVGFYYQGLFALTVLLDADDDSAISVETGDDVELTGNSPTLFQLKHSSGDPDPVSAKSDGFWKTLRIWSPHADDPDRRFVFATCAEVREDDPLRELLKPRPNAARPVKALVAEAERVREARAADTAARRSPRYAVRAAGCEAFLALTPDQRTSLLKRIRIASRQLNAAELPEGIANRLGNYLPPAIRSKVVERLIEWWDRQVALSLLKRRPALITKRELQAQLHQIIAQHSDEDLPDDFSFREPDTLDAELGSTMERQIRLVDGGEARLRRAAVARWRARHQRDRWMKDDFAFAAVLELYDDKLVERWSDRHTPMAEDCTADREHGQRRMGRELLDWSHNNAPHEIEPVRPRWSAPFLVQGSYQQLADQSRVGWHPRYRELLKKLGRKKGSDR